MPVVLLSESIKKQEQWYLSGFAEGKEGVFLTSS